MPPQPKSRTSVRYRPRAAAGSEDERQTRPKPTFKGSGAAGRDYVERIDQEPKTAGPLPKPRVPRRDHVADHLEKTKARQAASPSNITGVGGRRYPRTSELGPKESLRGQECITAPEPKSGREKDLERRPPRRNVLAERAPQKTNIVEQSNITLSSDSSGIYVKIPKDTGLETKQSQSIEGLDECLFTSETLLAQARQCYICGDSVQITRKRDWQYVFPPNEVSTKSSIRNHVLEDLKPYQCLEESCDRPDSTCAHLKDLRHHYRTCHPAAQILGHKITPCIFCAELLPALPRLRFSHVGRHMEEIAFAVIPRQYEDWEFYSESTIAHPLEQKSSKRDSVAPASPRPQKPSDMWSQLGSSVQQGGVPRRSRLNRGPGTVDQSCNNHTTKENKHNTLSDYSEPVPGFAGDQSEDYWGASKASRKGTRYSLRDEQPETLLKDQSNAEVGVDWDTWASTTKKPRKVK